MTGRLIAIIVLAGLAGAACLWHRPPDTKPKAVGIMVGRPVPK